MKKLLTLTFVLTTLVFGAQSFALNTDVKAETEVIAPIAVDIAGAVPSVTLAYSSTLRPGTSGAEVIALQSRLKTLGYYTLSNDGKYGPATANAVARFQAANKLSADGVAGMNTYASLSAQSAGPVMTLPPVADDINCNAVDAPVCGQLTINCITTPCPQPQPTTYGNSCYAKKAGATLLYEGECKKSADTVDPVACTMIYDPVCGQPHPIECVKAPCPQPQPTTYGNACMMGAANATLLYKGTCNTSTSIGAIPTLTANTSATLQAGSSSTAVATLQSSLKNLGYYTLNVDGKYGPATAAAVVKFQRAKALKADGIVGINTLTSLATASAVSANVATETSATAAVPTR